jgi:hypothetical protein
MLYYLKILSGGENFVENDPGIGSYSASIVNNYLYIDSIRENVKFYSSWRGLKLYKQIINDKTKSLALLNMRHDIRDIRLIAENILRGVVFEFERVDNI